MVLSNTDVFHNTSVTETTSACMCVAKWAPAGLDGYAAISINGLFGQPEA